MTGAVSARVLGSGQDGGLPQLGSDHPHDRAVRQGDLLERTASSVCVETGDGARLLLDASPDLRLQWWSFDRPPGAVALTHAHMGHYSGLVHVGREAAATDNLPCFTTPSMDMFLATHDPWRMLFDEGHLERRTGFTFEWEGLKVEMIPVPHRAELTDTVAISVDGWLLYLPDIDAWEQWPEAEDVIGRHPVALVDATFWSSEEMADPARMAEIPHPPVPETIERFSGLDTRIVLTHLNHTNPLCDPASAETATVLDAGFEVAHDGLLIRR